MTKFKFLATLQDRLAGLPREEVDERLRFYCEMIEDRMEEGLSEEDAVAAVGSVDEIVSQIAESFPLPNAEAHETTPKRQRKIWEILLLVLGSPLWVPLLLAALSVVLSLYVTLWTVIISLWAVFVSVAVCGLCAAVVGMGFAWNGKLWTGMALIGTGMVCVGLSVLLFFGCKAATAGTVYLTKKLLHKKKEA